jgi:phage terminase large subunit-like protein
MSKRGGTLTDESSRERAALPTREKQLFTVPHFRAWASTLVLDNDQPWELERFQADFVRDLFAGYLESWLIIPEGNAKTTLAAAVALYHAQFRKGARVVVAASSRDQAEWLFQAAAGFVDRSPALRPLFKCLEGYRRIRCDSVGSRIQVFAADDRTGDGAIFTLAILEELHRHRSLALYRTWRGKTEKRGGQVFAISTAGEPDGEFEAVRKRMKEEATAVKQRGAFLRAVSDTTVLHEYAVPEGRDPENLREVKKANPLKAITIPMLQRKHSSPAMTAAHWRRFVCGIPNNLESWIEPAMWDRLQADLGNVAEGDEVYVAVKVSEGVGIGLAAVRGDRVAVKLHNIPAPVGSRVPLAAVENAIRQLRQRYRVVDVAYDADQFLRPAEILAEEGFPMSEVPQRARRLSQATSTMWRLISSGLLTHDGDPELRSQVLAGRTKETIQGWHLDPQAGTPGLIAVALAVHEATELNEQKEYWVM